MSLNDEGCEGQGAPRPRLEIDPIGVSAEQHAAVAVRGKIHLVNGVHAGNLRLVLWHIKAQQKAMMNL